MRRLLRSFYYKGIEFKDLDFWMFGVQFQGLGCVGAVSSRRSQGPEAGSGLKDIIILPPLRKHLNNS